jgi:putative CocE/NonD family hydrolase
MKVRSLAVSVITCIVAASFFIPDSSAGAQATPVSDSYARSDVMTPMRDGVKLHSQVWIPKAAHGPLPFILSRWPYGWEGSSAFLDGAYRALAEEQYIFVFQDIRGRYQSEGQFIMIRPVRDKGDKKAIDESTDTYDTIQWLLRNIPNNNGRAGLLGISYGGWTTVMGMIDPHPALKAVSEQASPADMFIGDDFHHNGAFRLSYAFEYASAMETNGRTVEPFKFDAYDAYDWYLRLGGLGNIDAKYLHGKSPSWEDFVNHPNYDGFWKKQAIPPYLGEPKVPNLNVAGWWDQEDFYGPVTIYEQLEKRDPKHLNYLVVGPWNHGGWAFGEGAKLGKVEFGTNTSEHYRQKVEAPWFAYWLKDKGPFSQPEALVFQTGTNEWRSYDAWPPTKGVSKRKLYFGEAGRLSFDSPRTNSPAAFDSYVSDPSRPVPYRARPIPTEGQTGWETWLLEDQRFVHLRPDVLSWQTGPLGENITITGDIVAHLFASTTGSDADWVVKLIDVYPDDYPQDKTMGGYQLMISNEVLRARFRETFERPKPVPVGQVIKYDIDLHTNAHCFLKGHRIMVEVQSTWFPLIDRNPQKFLPSIFKARDEDFQKATHRVFRSTRFASNVELPIE